MKKLLTFFCLILLSGHSHSQDVFTGPFLERDGITYHQDTNELVTGIVELFYDLIFVAAMYRVSKNKYSMRTSTLREKSY